MTNKPMLSVERQCKECGSKSLSWHTHSKTTSGVAEGRLRSNEVQCLFVLGCNECSETIMVVDADRVAGELNKVRAILDNPVVESEFEPDAVCTESDGCPTEGAVLKRFWRENQPDTELCKFYEAEDCQSLVKELVGHVAQLQDAAKRNVKPWEDTFPPTLLPAYIARINAEHPEPAADHTQCEECKGWGYHENHHEGGGTECGECGGSGNATVAVVMPEREALRDIIAEAIGGDTYDCTRVWSAWGVGTMSDDDFVPVVEQDERLYEIADSVLTAVARLNGVKP